MAKRKELVLSSEELKKLQFIAKEKTPKRLTATCKCNGTVALLAALSVHRGRDYRKNG